MKILTVIPLQKNTFTEELTYFSSTEIPLGSIVTITIRNKKMLGLVISLVDANEMKSEIKNMDFNIKKVVETKEFSIFRDEFIESALVTSKYFVTNKSSTISYLIPQIIKENYDKIAKSYTKERKENDIKNKNITTEKLLFQAPTEERLSYYKTLIRTSFANKKSIFIVLPTSHDIEYWEENLQKGIKLPQTILLVLEHLKEPAPLEIPLIQGPHNRAHIHEINLLTRNNLFLPLHQFINLQIAGDIDLHYTIPLVIDVIDVEETFG